MPKPPRLLEPITLRLSDDLLSKLTEASHLEQTSRSHFIWTILESHVSAWEQTKRPALVGKLLANLATEGR